MGCEINLEACFINQQTMDIPCVRSIITLPEDRIAHIEQCRKWDAEWQADHGGDIPSKHHYENVGDITSTNDWYYHENNVGHLRFYADTPDWIVEIAVDHCWISERGEKMR